MNKLLLIVLAICLASTTQAATLRTMTTLHAPTVRLSDLFDDAGANADRVLGPGPGAGGRIVVEAAQLRAIARQFGVEWRPASSADRAVLDRPGRPLRRDDVLDAVRSALLSVTGEAMEPIHLRIAGRVDDTLELPVTAARLLAGSVLRAEDLHMARVHTSLLRGETVHRLADAIGMQARRQIAVGQPLVVTELVRPTIVQKGANVQMLLDSPGIILTAQGQAMEAGAIGERIRVVNPVSHAAVEATVIGPDRVRVAPNGVPLQ